jgi:4-hydroxy-3-polyprenylbenzoate decarboxylase
MNRNIVLAITGASGAPYAVRLLDVLLAAGRDVHLMLSEAGRDVLNQELGAAVDLDDFRPAALPLARPSGGDQKLDGVRARAGGGFGEVRYHHFRDFSAPVASGSFLTGGMVVCPCSLGTLSAIVHGTSANLIHRAAEVHLKERRKLILVPRETPLSLVHLDNLRRAAEAGAIILPAMPGFYHGVKNVGDLVDFLVARICDQLGIEHDLMRRWGAEPT